MRSLFMYRTMLVLNIFLFLSSCSKEIDESVVVSLNSEKEILEFKLEQQINPTLIESREGEINTSESIVVIGISNKEKGIQYKPSITISKGATISPSITEPKDFSKSVVYTITAEDESRKQYTILPKELSSSTTISSFDFIVAENPELNNSYFGKINLDESLVEFRIPFGVDITSLIPKITLGTNMRIKPESGVSLDFSKDVSFIVVAEDGTEKEYTVRVNQASMSQKEILLDYYRKNPGHDLNWSEVLNMEEWRGVTLNLDKNIIKLNLIFTNNERETIVPEAIGDLYYLEELSMNSLGILSIPSTLGNLENLKLLRLSGNRLSEIPKELGSLQNLKELYLSFNELKQIPSELGNLNSLRELNLSNNPLEFVPEIICSLREKGIQVTFDENVPCK